jgi:hypothetical protein
MSKDRPPAKMVPQIELPADVQRAEFHAPERQTTIDPDRAADDARGQRRPGEDLAERQDKLLDEAIEETYPASDPIAPKRIA